MSNPLAINPSVMINRLVDRQGTPMAAQLAKVAELRMALENAVKDEQAREALFSPSGKVDAPVVDSGAVVDRLV